MLLSAYSAPAYNTRRHRSQYAETVYSLPPMTRITVQNRTGRPLVPYLMVETNSGRKRLAQAALTVPAGGSYELDPRGGNPVFFDPQGAGQAGQATRPGMLVELPLPQEPQLLASTVFSYTSPPDRGEGSPVQPPHHGQRTVCRLAQSTTAVTISLNSSFAVSFEEHGDAVASAS
ncbi:MAG: hypothetical protein ACI9EF_000127 [Pseudohongiellaceae bacterium]|jgi:hypothetical protein